MLVVMLAGCGVDTAAVPEGLGTACSDPNSTTKDCFETSIGTTCNAAKSQLCAGGEGYCTGSVCRNFCAVVNVGFRCEGIGGVEHHEVGFEGADVCTCW